MRPLGFTVVTRTVTTGLRPGTSGRPRRRWLAVAKGSVVADLTGPHGASFTGVGAGGLVRFLPEGAAQPTRPAHAPQTSIHFDLPRSITSSGGVSFFGSVWTLEKLQSVRAMYLNSRAKAQTAHTQLRPWAVWIFHGKRRRLEPNHLLQVCYPDWKGSHLEYCIPESADCRCPETCPRSITSFKGHWSFIFLPSGHWGSCLYISPQSLQIMYLHL